MCVGSGVGVLVVTMRRIWGYQRQETAFLFTLTLASQVYTPSFLHAVLRDHGGRVVTLSPPSSEAGVQFLARPQVEKLVVACCWSAVYSTEP